jgi:cobalt-zinc-cadmium resistance protein CzcA
VDAPIDQSLEKIVVNASPSEEIAHPLLVLQQQNVNIVYQISVFRKIQISLSSRVDFSPTCLGAKDPLSGFSVSASFPVFSLGAYKSKVKAANAEMEVQQRKLEYETQVFQTNKGNALAEIDKNSALLQFYESSGLKQADAIIKAASLGYRTGEINFAGIKSILSQAIGIRQNYLEVLNQYNQSAIQYNYFNNK